MTAKTDCRFYLGDRPCKPHKEKNVHCEDCSFYRGVQQNILIIKLGAAGDVIRTTPILSKIREDYPKAQITWLTDFPDFVPDSLVENVVPVDERNIYWLSHRKFDIVYSLDKDPIAISLCEGLEAEKKYGFGMDEYGHARALDAAAAQKIETGIWDDVGKENKLSYLDEIFAISGYQFNGEKYLLEKRVNHDWNIDNSKIIVGLNTGCGIRWPSRLWPESHWEELANSLEKVGYSVIWLGGPQEDEKNKKMSSESCGWYPGFFSIHEFIDLVDQCDIVITQVTMALHISLALEKRIVLMNNIFNKNEFEMFGLGEIVEPPIGCDCYFAPKCKADKECMKSITPDIILRSIEKQKLLLNK